MSGHPLEHVGVSTTMRRYGRLLTDDAEVDGMGNIEHWLIAHPMSGSRTFAVTSPAHVDDYRRREGYEVTGPFVLASQLEGAVDLADAADALVRRILGNGSLTRADVQPLVDALDAYRHGGQ